MRKTGKEREQARVVVRDAALWRARLAVGDPSAFGHFDDNDPKSVARVMRKLGRDGR